MGKASDWLREERRKTLGDWVSFCITCGFATRYFDESEAELPVACPQCGGQMRSRCPSCDARFSSVFAVECEACGEELRPADAFVLRVRSVVLERTRRDLDRLGRQRGKTEVVAALAYRFLKLLRTWFSEIERVTEELTLDELPLDGRRALAQLRAAAASRQ